MRLVSLRRVLSRGVAAVSMVAVVIVGVQAVASADPRVPVSITAVAPTVESGDYLSYNVSISCSIPDSCPNTTMTVTAPAAASGPPVVAQPYPTGVDTVTPNADGTVTISFTQIAVGQTLQLTVSWPTTDYTTPPGPQTVTATATAPSGMSPSTATVTNQLVAAPHPHVTKTAPATITAGQSFAYALTVQNAQTGSGRQRGNLAMENVVLSDVLPGDLEFVSANGSATYDPATRTVAWNLDPLTDAAPHQVTVTVRVPVGSTMVGSDITNTGTLTGTPFGGGSPVSGSGSATTTVGAQVSGVSQTVAKTGPNHLQDGQTVWYEASTTNTSSVPVTATITDPIPAGLNVTWVRLHDMAVWGDINNGMFHIGFSDGSVEDIPTPGTVDTVRAGKRVTSVSVDVPGIDPGVGVSVSLNVVADLAAIGGPGFDITNCASSTITTSSGESTSGQACATAGTRERVVSAQMTKSTDQAPVNPGATKTWSFTITNDPRPMRFGGLRAEIIDLLPNELTYVADSWALAAGQPSGCPAASAFDVVVTPGYADGRDAVIATARPGELIPNSVTVCTYTLQTVVRPGTPAGTYGGDAAQPTYAGNRAYLLDADNYLEPWSNNFVANDPNDIDHDGNLEEGVVTTSEDFAVAQSAQAGIAKRVQGDRDTSMYGSAEVTGQDDQVGHSTPGGSVTYQVELGNTGNVALTNVVAYDLLPRPGVHGVTDGRYDDTTQYQFVPTMTGPISVAGAPVTVTYSTSSDPCRPEMDATLGSASFYCGGTVDPTFVVASAVTDWSQIRSIRFDFGNHVLVGGEQYTFTWTMAVPTTDSNGDPVVDGLRTWNKVAIQGDRLTSGGSTSPLLPAEAPWVVDEIVIPYAIGDTVWSDQDRDGIQDSWEPPVPGVTVMLTDASGDPVNDVDGNPVAPVVTDASGNYRFDNLASGSYVVVFTAPAGAGFTTSLAGSNQTIDSDADRVTGRSGVITLSPAAPNVTLSIASDHVTAPQIDRTIDAGIVFPSNPSVSITKRDAAGNDANTVADEVVVPSGSATRIELEVTNTGDVPLGSVVIRDSTIAGPDVTGLTCTFPDGTTATAAADGSVHWAASFGTPAVAPWSPGVAFVCLGSVTITGSGVRHGDESTVLASDLAVTSVSASDEFHAKTATVPVTTTTATTTSTTTSTPEPPGTTTTSLSSVGVRDDAGSAPTPAPRSPAAGVRAENGLAMTGGNAVSLLALAATLVLSGLAVRRLQWTARRCRRRA